MKMLTTLSLLFWIHSTFQLGSGFSIPPSSSYSSLKSSRSYNSITNKQYAQNQIPNTNSNDLNSCFTYNHRRHSCLQPITHKHGKTWKLSSHYAIMDANEGNEAMNEDKAKSIRTILRKLTGFSLTAFRVSVRATTTSIRATLRASTGVSLTAVLHKFVGMFPLWVRSFMQPFLILYYTPLIILQSMIGSTSTSNREARQSHELFVDGLKNAVEVAEKVNEGGYWPVHVNENGGIDFVPLPDPDSVLESSDYVNALVDSIEIAASVSEKKTE